MKRMMIALFVLMIGVGTRAGDAANYNVVPLPQSIVEQKGEPFVLEEGVQILAPADLQNEAEFLRQYMKEVTRKSRATTCPSSRDAPRRCDTSNCLSCPMQQREKVM